MIQLGLLLLLVQLVQLLARERLTNEYVILMLGVRFRFKLRIQVLGFSERLGADARLGSHHTADIREETTTD